MKKLDSIGCKFCGGVRLVYRSTIRGSFRIRYFRCVTCGATSKTMQRLSLCQMLTDSRLPSVALERTIETDQFVSRCEVDR